MQQLDPYPALPPPDAPPQATTASEFNPQNITRPDQRLQTYYLILGAISGVIPLFPLLAKFHTLQYRFDDEGVSMKWGLLFRHEVHLTYRRIQDIHLTRNLLQRWLGLATVSIQTASGSATPEMKIEGILEADALRDHLYQRMRGARGLHDPSPCSSNSPTSSQAQRIENLLIDIRDSLRTRLTSPPTPASVVRTETSLAAPGPANASPENPGTETTA